jgi:hypothetical protein
MGNVAHDLKTPLHSIMAEVEHLRQTIQDICDAATVVDSAPPTDRDTRAAAAAAAAAAADTAAAAAYALSDPHRRASMGIAVGAGAGAVVNAVNKVTRRIVDATEESFDSLDTTCRFLVMAINRSQVGG